PQTPTILKKQIKTLVLGLIAPKIISEIVQIGLERISRNFSVETHIDNTFAVGLSSLLITGAAFYCTNKILKLRFLNIKSHVQSLSNKFNFINDFRGTLEQLSHASTARELTVTIKDFFHKAFQIPSGRTALYFRTFDQSTQPSRLERNSFRPLIKTVYAEPDELRISLVEGFFNNDSEVQKYLLEKRILIYDEIEFSNFYDDNQVRKKILSFLEQINAEIFIPIYQEGSVAAYIVIERDPRRKELYSDLDRDEIIVFASYLENTINLLQKQNVDSLVLREKELREELFLKQQEVQQYKESLRSFLKQPHKKIGILFYKNRSFVFANQEAKELLKINPNLQENNPLAQQLRRLARQVLEYKAAQNGFVADSTGQQLVISAVPNLEQNNVILTVTYPELSDIIKKQIDKLHDPSRWDYLLYLETTESGRLINQLIPGTGEQLLNFKLSLLQMALSKKAILLQLPKADLLSTVEIIHHISMRQKLHVLEIQGRSTNLDAAVKLFGINSIFGKRLEAPPLLQSLNNGTLLIKNIDFLDLETQNYLAEFIKYGFYHVFKSEQKESSDVRIICTTNQDLRELVREGRFSTELYQELKETTLSLPSLLTLPEAELSDLIDDLSTQLLSSHELANLPSLSDKQRKKLLSKELVSIAEFKQRVQRLLSEKAQEQALVIPALQVDKIVRTADPELIEIAKLGKHALKDPKIMGQLWQKFQNQNKIAAFLGVNRSSVHRRCKDYNLA
ncbi:MAG TPA: sigma 54-interacting transcriptional regulator, partial [Candidatus Babeliales bacterium]|nr:sigma 54-interacting transcriptional regulator [Candidatus Babeliales bacterium]